MSRLFADALFGAVTLMWLYLAGYHADRYIRPRTHEWKRRPQTISTFVACLCTAALVASRLHWVPVSVLTVADAFAVMGGSLGVVIVYLYEMQRGRRRGDLQLPEPKRKEGAR